MIDIAYPSYTSPKLKERVYPAKGGYGVFALEPIKRHELLCAWGGVMVPEADLYDLPHEIVTHGIQIEEGMYLMPAGGITTADYINHSCNPNAGLSGQVCLIAMRDIAVGEEICFDYAMSDTTDYDEFECHCGVSNCRERITGNDWMIPALHRRYHGYFMPYIQRRIDALYNKRTVSGKKKVHGKRQSYDIKVVSGKRTVYGIKIVSGKKAAIGRKSILVP